jgi:hypothetical protein
MFRGTKKAISSFAYDLERLLTFCFYFDIAVVQVAVDLHLSTRRFDIEDALFPLASGEPDCGEAREKNSQL